MTGYKNSFHSYNEHFLMTPECSLQASSTVLSEWPLKAGSEKELI